jgi:hypothetical protein
MENITLSIEEVYEDIKERAFAEGAFSREQWRDLVDEILDAKRDFGETHDDVDWEEMREALVVRYEEFAEEIPEM